MDTTYNFHARRAYTLSAPETIAERMDSSQALVVDTNFSGALCLSPDKTHQKESLPYHNSGKATGKIPEQFSHGKPHPLKSDMVE
jgi:hypothetical protein